MYLSSYSCCGVREIGTLGAHRGPGEALWAFASEVGYNGIPGIANRGFGNDRFRFVIFSQAQSVPGKDLKYGDKFAAYIANHDLGEVISTGIHVNPNSGNHLKVFVWTIDHEAVKSLLTKDSKARKRAAEKKKAG